jgi:hypothetical protein
MKKGKQIAYTAAGTFVFLLLLDFALMMWQVTPISDVTQYENVIGLRWLRPDLIKHFPKTIPSNAWNPAFFYRAGFWQGGASIELKLQMPAQFMDETSTAYRSKANFRFWEPDRTMTGANKAGRVPYLSRIDKSKKSYESPDSAEKFETFVLSECPPVSLNHGERAGLYIDSINNVITYRAEDW